MGPVGIVMVFVLILAGVLALLNWALGLIGMLAIGFVGVCLLMMLVVLIQKPKGGGLSGAFGGGGGGAETAFGAKTGDVLTWVTIGCFVGFLGLAMGLTWAIRPSDVQEQPPVLLTPEQQGDADTAPDSAAPGQQDESPTPTTSPQDLIDAIVPETLESQPQADEPAQQPSLAEPVEPVDPVDPAGRAAQPPSPVDPAPAQAEPADQPASNPPAAE